MKKNIKLMLIIIAVIAVIGLGITFAYYTIAVDNNPSSDNIQIGAGTVSLVFADGTSKIEATNVLPGWSATKTFTVTNTSTATDAVLSYDVILEVTENGFNNGSFVYSLASTDADAASKAETSINKGVSELTMGSATITGTGTVHTYTLTVTYKNLSSNQNDEMGAFFKAYATIVSSGQIAEEPEPSGGGMASEIIANATSSDGLYDYGTAGYRYSGATPNNYITFNGETWRIIGFIDGSQIGKEAGTYYTKIIKNAKLETDLAWDTNSTNTWSTSTLYSTLNGNAAYTGNANVEAVDWHHTAQDSSSVKTSAMYTAEGWGTSCSTSSKNCTKSAKVGIMSPSDYGYAASSACQSGYNLGSYSNSTCTSTNWLYISGTFQWLLEPGASFTYNAWYVFSDGSVNSVYFVTYSLAVRPVVYLKSTATVLGGDGKVGSPYTIS